MKKKIIVLVLVLGLASVANAELFISVNSGENPGVIENVLPTTIIMLDITGDGQTPHPVNPYLLIEGPGAISAGVLVYPGTLSVYWNAEEIAADIGITVEEAIASFRDYLGRATLSDMGWASLNDSTDPPAAIDGLLVDAIEFLCLDEGDVTVTLISADFQTEYDKLVIQQIPEPITFALLGLGGLFLRRRK